LVFTISSSSLTLHAATGVWFNKSTAGLAGTPFWNNSPLDGAGGNNVGWCI
jgi:hypothetical protein